VCEIIFGNARMGSELDEGRAREKGSVENEQASILLPRVQKSVLT